MRRRPVHRPKRFLAACPAEMSDGGEVADVGGRGGALAVRPLPVDATPVGASVMPAAAPVQMSSDADSPSKAQALQSLRGIYRHHRERKTGGKKAAIDQLEGSEGYKKYQQGHAGVIAAEAATRAAHGGASEHEREQGEKYKGELAEAVALERQLKPREAKARAKQRGQLTRVKHQADARHALARLHTDMHPEHALSREIVETHEEHPKGVNRMHPLSHDRRRRIGLGRHHFWSDWSGEADSKRATSGRSSDGGDVLHEPQPGTGAYFDKHAQVIPHHVDSVRAGAEAGSGMMMSMLDLHKKALSDIKSTLTEDLFEQRKAFIRRYHDENHKPYVLTSGPKKGEACWPFDDVKYASVEANPLHDVVLNAFSETSPFDQFTRAWGSSSAEYAKVGANALMPGDSHGATAHTNFAETIQAKYELQAFRDGVHAKVDGAPGDDHMTVAHAARLTKLAALPNRQMLTKPDDRDNSAHAAGVAGFQHAAGMQAAGEGLKKGADGLLFDRQAYQALPGLDTPRMEGGSEARDQRSPKQMAFAQKFDIDSSAATSQMEDARGDLLHHMASVHSGLLDDDRTVTQLHHREKRQAAALKLQAIRTFRQRGKPT